MDISEAVTEHYKMKRGNYAVDVSNSVWIVVANRNTSPGYITSTHIRKETVPHYGQEATSGACDNSSYNRQARG